MLTSALSSFLTGYPSFEPALLESPAVFLSAALNLQGSIIHTQCSVGENMMIRARQKPCSRPAAGTHKATDKTDGRAPKRTKVKTGDDCQQAARSQVVCSHCYCVVRLKTIEWFKYKCNQVNLFEVGNLFCKGDLAAGNRQKPGTIEKCVWDKQRSSPV